MTGQSGTYAKVIDRIILPPDPGLIASLGSNHTLDSAIGDLIDNCLDAEATVVRVRFLTRRYRLRALSVLDNGCGMDSTQINDAMTIGRRRQYAPGSLGNFGLGLKAAALGCADTLTVWSHATGATPVGRRLHKQSLSQDFGCDILATDSAITEAKLLDGALVSQTGTAVVLDAVRATYRGTSDLEAQTFLDTTVERVRLHLGLIFHRWISRRGLRIEIEVVEETDTERSVPMRVHPMDPFAYRSSGYPGYPRTLIASFEDTRSAKLECHIWPARNDVAGFRLGKGSGDALQGFYVYRADRLLQIGGWDSATTSRPERRLARVVIDDDSLIGDAITINPEKHGIRFSPALLHAINNAISADMATTFDDYIANAEEAYRTARRRSRTRKPTVRPDKGFSPKLRKAIAGELDFIEGVDPIEVRWRTLPLGEFFDIGFRERTVWLNSRYRELIVPSRGGLNDAPLVKALVYLLTRDVFEGEYLGSRDRDNIALWRAVLETAIQEEELWRDRQE
ncbi:DNA mismatch repair enzyme (ATPase) [Parafrankia sp. Ea1.12]|uniref:ATP-binding protein n=1 Tax=Parafrankia sp. Ea1.12 TaxID=573499 RepID=UPI000DA5566D|nr:ATP-binding protein [Parafrankia sp. Ea1.12]SQE00132.1 DNA mismatch repair enzyme (ATPase) [Parafrankia sp. Ea1.12]